MARIGEDRNKKGACLQVRKGAVTRTELAGTLILDRPAFKSVKKTQLHFSQPVCSILLWQPEPTEAHAVHCAWNDFPLISWWLLMSPRFQLK